MWFRKSTLYGYENLERNSLKWRRRNYSRPWSRTNQCFKWAKERKEEKQIIQRRNHLLENPIWRKENERSNVDSNDKEGKRVWEAWKGSRVIESWSQQAKQTI